MTRREFMRSAAGTAVFDGGCYDQGTGEQISDLGAEGSFERVYESEVAGQVQEVTEKKGPGDLASLLDAGDTWEVQ